MLWIEMFVCLIYGESIWEILLIWDAGWPINESFIFVIEN